MPTSSSSTKKAIPYPIELVAVSKSFRKKDKTRRQYSTLKSNLLGWLKSLVTPIKPSTKNIEAGNIEADDQKKALDNITLRIPKGHSVGIVGRNGSGKSTLLKLISGVYKADSGTIRTNGRIAALLELGAGFHPDFTGRENVFLGGTLHGLTHSEIQERFAAIVEFAELEAVIDEPVRTYSSGMFMRLAFSLAIHTDPDLLIVDEVLAVGDAAFVTKCKDRITQLLHKGITLLMVSHDLPSVERWCDEVLWLHQGEVMERGSPRRTIDHYRQFLALEEETQLLEAAQRAEEHKAEAAESLQQDESSNSEEPQEGSTSENDDTKLDIGILPYERWGGREVEITSIEMLDANLEPHRVFGPDSTICIRLRYRIQKPIDDIVFGVAINRSDTVHMTGTNTQIEDIEVPPLHSEGEAVITIPRLGLNEGAYYLDIAVHDSQGYPYDYHQHVSHFLIRSDKSRVGMIVPELQWKFSHKEGQSKRKAL